MCAVVSATPLLPAPLDNQIPWCVAAKISLFIPVARLSSTICSAVKCACCKMPGVNLFISFAILDAAR